MKKSFKSFFTKVLLGVIMVTLALPNYSISASVKPSPSPTKKSTETATKKPVATTKKPTTTKKPVPVVTKKTSNTTNNFGYKGKKDASDIDIPPVLTQLSSSALGEGGSVFKLPDIASAANVLSLITADLAEANFKCESTDPTISPLISSLPGSVKNDTLASCKSGDPVEDGFVVYVITDKTAVLNFNTPQNVANYLKFISPLTGTGEQTQFTPSNRAILFIVGGQFAFDASEIAWGVLYNLRFQPPNRNA